MALMFLLGVFSKGYAQGQDQNYQWIGNDVSSVINNSNADMNTIIYIMLAQKSILTLVLTGEQVSLHTKWVCL